MIHFLIIFLLFFSWTLQAQNFSEAIAPIFKLYSRPITILTIGETETALSFQNKNQKHTLIIATENPLSPSPYHPFIHLKKNLNLFDLKDLNTLEHFDLVIAIYPFQNDVKWKEMIDELFKLGDHLVILGASKEKARKSKEKIAFKMTHYLTNLGLKIPLTWEEEDPLLWFCFKPPSVNPKIYQKAPRKEGISLFTFQKYFGSFSLKTSIEEKLSALPFWIRPFTRFIRIALDPQQQQKNNSFKLHL